ncbi:MAG: hypothetical protein HZC54_15350 [Verrucomicrobia bacterium]|nr:hypothetical protein [Verrucomicrobiota bacterium]
MEEDIQLRDLIRALWRQKWWIMLLTLLVMTATAAVSLSLPKVYRATATLVPPEVDQAWPTPDGLKTRFGATTVGGAIRPGTTATDIVMGILRSRRVALAVIQKFDLQRVYPAEAGLKLPPMPWKLPGENKVTLSDILEKLGDRTDIRVTKEGLLSVSVQDHNPQRAADMVQCYLDELARANADLLTTYNQYVARVLDAPMVPDRKYAPRVMLNTALGGACMVFLWIGGSILRLILKGPGQPTRQPAAVPNGGASATEHLDNEVAQAEN